MATTINTGKKGLNALTNLRRFFPENREIFLVFGVVLFAVHSWSIRAFLYNLPSLILYMNIGQVTSVFAYMMAFAFMESLLVIGLLILISAILPPNWFRNKFASKSFLTILVGALLAIDIRISTPNRYPGMEFLFWRVLLSAVILIASLLAMHYFRPVQKGIDFILEQMTIMTYIYLPIGVFSLVIVLARNIF
jgi:hypothetical protein